jgi:aminoglycoside phosphotransferase (APT) family kinase protein
VTVTQRGDVVDRIESDGGPVPLLVLAPLAEFLDRRGIGSGPIQATPIGDGHSFVTFLLTRDDIEVVLRRPPRPPWRPGAQDVLREARVLAALGPTNVRAPRLLASCDDMSVIGAPFTITERVEGRVIATDLPAPLDVPLERRRVAEEMVDALVELHDCDFAAHGLGDLGRPQNYLSRRIDRFLLAAGADPVRELPAVMRVADRLRAAMPTSGEPALIHGDYRLGNVLYAEQAPARLTAILDWETVTLGDPLTDLGYLVATYPEPGDADGVLLSLQAVATRPGFLSRAELVARYEKRSGRTAADLEWYMAYSMWRVAVQLEGLYRRYVRGDSTDPFHGEQERGVPELLARAEALL